VPTEPTTPPAATAPAAQSAPTGASVDVPPGTWLSGAAGTGVASGEFAAWRGSPVPIAGTWADNNIAQVELWSLDPGQELGAWTQSIDLAIGAIGPGETWAAAATGAYDGRWQQSLTNLRDAWGGRPGTVFLRFAHEMNSDWYPWSVSVGQERDFITAWGRFRALQERIFPDVQLVFCVNRESVGTGMDWRRTFPGAEQVDVMGVDYYNQYPYVGSAMDWAASVNQTDSYGAPKGLQAHLDFARSVGLPLAVPEWSGKASQGDSAAYIQGMHDFFATNAGGGPGQLLYEVQFNVDMHGDDYRLFGGGQLRLSAQRYRDLF
jgi:hypothetical protein